jgi:tetratricopeptide (TPR) repeat protein
MSLVTFTLAAFIVVLFLGKPSYSETPVYADLTTEKLIDELMQIEQQAPGLAGLGLYETFIVEDRSARFTMGVLGAAPPAVPPQMREVVRRGISALPLLIHHLDDARPSKLVVGADGPQFFFMFRLYGAEYDPRSPDPEKKRTPLDLRNGKSFAGGYTVKVGDICYVLIGQIVNRNLTAVRYQPTGGLVVNSPLQSPSLIENVKSDWAGLDAQGHEASLLNDIRTVESGPRAPSALRRLRYYYSQRYDSLQGDDLAKKQEFEADEQDYVQQANLYTRTKEYAKAAEEWTKWIKIAPNSAKGYSRRGDAFIEAERLAEAIQDYTHALELEKRPAFLGIILAARARAYKAQGAIDLQIADYKEVIRLNPKDVLTYKHFADSLDDQGQSQLAIEFYNQALQHSPNNAMLYEDRGIAYRRMGNVERALEDYNKSLELAPNRASTFNSRAWALMTAGRLDEALADITRAATIDPNATEIMDTRAHILSALNRTEEAIVDFDAAIQGGKTNPITFFGRGKAFERLGALEKAIADYQRCIEMRAGNPNDRDSQEKARAKLKMLLPQ